MSTHEPPDLSPIDRSAVDPRDVQAPDDSPATAAAAGARFETEADPRPGLMPAGRPVRAPLTVDRAAKGLVLLAGWTVIGVALTYLSLDQRREQAREADTTLTDAQVERAVDLSVQIGVVVSAIVVVVAVLCARQIRLGKGWARGLATTTTAILAVLSLLGFGASGAGTVGIVVRLVSALVCLAVIAWLWVRPSSVFFAAARLR